MFIPPGFNPLHCGAVVASCVCGSLYIVIILFQSPSLRGSGRFIGEIVSFADAYISFNPLHCGAVVASSARSAPILAARLCFNPLHCGAVVASVFCGRGAPRRRHVSIPFIAGQWSLHGIRLSLAWGVRVSQSPSLRGSGRFSLGRGSKGLEQVAVSIPFIAGQWSLLCDGYGHSLQCVLFQSPSLRGSGRFVEIDGRVILFVAGFNPLHCGAVVASRARAPTSLRPACFNPLHCGAVVASGNPAYRSRGLPSVSIPFIAGQWSLRPGARAEGDRIAQVSIPFIAGQWSLRAGPGPRRRAPSAFQSPSLRGSGRFSGLFFLWNYGSRVSIPFIAGQWSLLQI